tara:strand:+ start:2614 stop:2829 length:216 start_codon:yes stop_codon:yes gene_type:complete
MTYRNYDANGKNIGWPSDAGLVESIHYGRFGSAHYTLNSYLQSHFMDGGNFDNGSSSVTVPDVYDGGDFGS